MAGDFWCNYHFCWNCNRDHSYKIIPDTHFQSTFQITDAMEPIKSEDLMYKEPAQRKYLPTLSELIDRLSITQQKEIYIPDHREEYSQEIKDILHDINLILEEQKPELTGDLIRNIVILTQMNTWIWNNESNFRKGIKEGNNLELTHGLNGVRNTAKNKIQESVGGRKDYKVDNVEAFKQWIPSW